MKNLLLLAAFILLASTSAQNKLYVRVEYNPSMQILGYGGSGFYYDHILLLPDGTAYRYDDISENSEQVLPSDINLATATAAELASSGGTQGTYQDDGTTVTTSFGATFPSAGGKYDSDFDLSDYMYIPPLQPSFITGEYNNFSGTLIGGGFTPVVSAAESNNYFFYADGKFGFEESKGVSSDAGSVATTFSSEGSAAGSYLFEGYNLFINYNDGTQATLPAYLWPPYQAFVDQILMVGENEFLNEEESSLPIELLPATGAAPANSSAQNPLAGNQNSETQNPLTTPAQNPLSAPSTSTPQNPLSTTPAQNPLSTPSQQTTEPETTGPQTPQQGATNPLATPQQNSPVTPAPGNTLSGTVALPEGVTRSSGFVILCPYDAIDESACINTPIEASGAYSLEIPGEGQYIVMAAMDVDGNAALNTGDYATYQNFSASGNEAKTLDFLLGGYTE